MNRGLLHLHSEPTRWIFRTQIYIIPLTQEISASQNMLMEPNTNDGENAAETGLRLNPSSTTTW